MSTSQEPLGVPSGKGFFRAVAAFVSGLSLVPEHVALVPARDRSTRGMPSARTTIWPLLLGVALLVAAPAWAEQTSLPDGVPNIHDPNVLARFTPMSIGNMGGNPDFPLVLLVNTEGDQPRGLLLGLDARNGKNTWSLNADPAILVVLLSDPTTVQEAFVDAGFVDMGKASGNYAAVDKQSLPALPDLLQSVPAPDEDAPDDSTITPSSPRPVSHVEL